RGAWPDDVAAGLDDVHVAAELRAPAGVGLDADAPRPPEVRRPTLEVDAGVVEEHVTLLERSARGGKRERQVAGQREGAFGNGLRDDVPYGVDGVADGAQLEDAPKEQRRQIRVTDAGRQHR